MKQILLITAVSMMMISCEDILCDCENTEPYYEELICNELYPGFWKTTSDCSSPGINSYTITINESNDCLSTTFYNFLGDGEIIDIDFNTQSITIPRQEFDKSDDIFGTGFLRNDTLRITFTLKDRTFDWEDLCEVIAVRE
ncbi:MAG: hypothetical protein MI922_20985 [Bacteroidales bacterium]|nr:hypothetical protein [Bacteroidales bacterium]